MFLEHNVRQREREARERDEEEGAEALPEAVEERDRGRVVVLEAEPARAREALHARDVVPRLAGVQHDERARHDEGRDGEPAGDSKTAPLPPAREEERHGEVDGGVLRGDGKAGREAGPLEPVDEEECERHGDAEGQQDIRHRHVRVRHMHRRDRTGGARHEPRGLAVGGAPEPPRRRHARDPDGSGDGPRGSVRGLREERLERREHVEQQARIVVPTGVEAVALADRPRARDDRLLVGIQQREREPVPQPRQAQRRRQREQAGGYEPAAVRPRKRGHR